MTFGTNQDDDFAANSVNSKAQLEEMKTMFEFEPTDSVVTIEVSTLYAQFMQISAVINALGLMTIIEYDSVNEAQVVRKDVFTKLEEFLISVTDDDLYNALYDLQTSVARDIEIRVSQLPRLAELVLNNALPALTVAHDLYGNIDEEQDIVDRNRVEHPTFVPGGQSTEVRIFV